MSAAFHEALFPLDIALRSAGQVAQWAMFVLTAYFGGRSLEKVARILSRR